MSHSAERKREQVCSWLEYQKVFQRIDTIPEQVEHLVVQLGILPFNSPPSRSSNSRKRGGIPIAYPRLVFLERSLKSKFNPLVHLGKAGSLGLSGFVNKFNAEAELLDDLVSFICLYGAPRLKRKFAERSLVFGRA
jgi:hypothetical protein